ncbi:UNVERIFIED_CONTAM: hypothetical protein HDU68_004755 [Siphonaria sp. JEL0065]|nr:hypothetical protein HDU68_004755 [Siphonaria sp. JEL0065]
MPNNELMGRRGSHDSAVSTSSGAGSSIVTAAVDLRKRSKSASRSAWDGVAPEVMNAVTLGHLQTTQSTLTANLYKLNSSSNATASSPQNPEDWKLRFFVLSAETGNLYLFKTNATQKSMPVTFMPVQSYSVSVDHATNTYLLRPQGDGMTPEGKVVKRVWTLKFPDETTLSMWAKNIHRFLDSVSSSASPSTPTSTRPHTPERTSFSRSIASRESADRSSVDRANYHQQSQLNPIQQQNQLQQQQQQEYQQRQQFAQEKYRQEQMLRWAQEDKERADRERERIEWERQQKISKEIEFQMIDKGLESSKKKNEEKAKEKADMMKAMMGL